MAAPSVEPSIESLILKYKKPECTLYRPTPYRYTCPECGRYAFRSKTKRIFEEVKCSNCCFIITDCDMERYRYFEPKIHSTSA